MSTNAWSKMTGAASGAKALRRPNTSTIRRALAVILLMLAALPVLAACSSPASSSASAAGSTSAADADAATTESTALVVFANGNDVLFVDQDTQTPYFPTIPAEGIIAQDGATITADDLAVGNVVAIEGNGIMLESYPGQYPGITSIRVIAQGSPADAEPYQSIVDEVFVPVDPASIPTGSVSYRTDLADTSLMLNPYSYQWFGGDDQAGVALDGWFADDNGLITEGTPDAIIAEATQATATFDRGFQSIEVNRWPLAESSEGRLRMDLTASQQPVDHATEESGSAVFTIEPGYAYGLSVKFANGDASFAFVATA